MRCCPNARSGDKSRLSCVYRPDQNYDYSLTVQRDCKNEKFSLKTLHFSSHLQNKSTDKLASTNQTAASGRLWTQEAKKLMKLPWWSCSNEVSNWKIQYTSINITHYIMKLMKPKRNRSMQSASDHKQVDPPAWVQNGIAIREQVTCDFKQVTCSESVVSQ